MVEDQKLWDSVLALGNRTHSVGFHFGGAKWMLFIHSTPGRIIQSHLPPLAEMKMSLFSLAGGFKLESISLLDLDIFFRRLKKMEVGRGAMINTSLTCHCQESRRDPSRVSRNNQPGPGPSRNQLENGKYCNPQLLAG